MKFPAASNRLQRFLGGSVAALLTANTLAVASLVSDGSGSDGLRRPGALGDVIEPTADTPRDVTLITTRDGRTFLADPRTAEGRQAIEQAQGDGATLQTVPVPPGSSPGGSKSPGGSSLELPGLDGLLPMDDGGGGLIDDPGDDPIGTTVTTVLGVVKDTVHDVTDTVREVTKPVTDAVDDLTQPVTDGATDALDSVTVPVAPVAPVPPVSSVIGDGDVPTTGGLLGGVLDALDSAVDSANPPVAEAPCLLLC